MTLAMAFLMASLIIAAIVVFVTTLAGIINIVTDGDFKAYIRRIKSEYGYVYSPLRLGAIFQSMRFSSGATYWKPVESTVMYGWPVFLLQFFNLKPNSEIEAKRVAMYTKLISRETGYDQ